MRTLVTASILAAAAALALPAFMILKQFCLGAMSVAAVGLLPTTMQAAPLSGSELKAGAAVLAPFTVIPGFVRTHLPLCSSAF